MVCAMARVLLQDQQRALLQRERSIAGELQSCLTGIEGAEAHATTLQQILATLDDLFLLVIVGEFNAGKSACINALLRDSVVEEGVTPTTYQITILRYSPQKTQSVNSQGILEIQYPADFLHDISIVDTPGVNAVLREHEKLTEDFVPRSDLILFVTSVDRPFTQSERLFLERIRQWGKKVVILLNKIDMLRGRDDLQKVITFVRDNCLQLLGFQPQIIPLSALLAQQSRTAIGHQAIDLWERSRFGVLEDFLFFTLDEKERIRLKLLSPLGVMQRLLDTAKQSVQQRVNLLAEDERTISTIETQLKLYREDMERDFAHRLSDIENIILTMRNRGDHFLDETIRLVRVLDLIQSQKVREEFERDVVGDSATRIDQTVQELIDWLVEHEHRLWQDVMEYLERRRKDSLVSIQGNDVMVGSVTRQFDYDRRTLLQSVARSAATVVQTYDRQAEADQLSQDLRTSVTQAAIAGASGIGLGALIVAFVGTAAADVSGILAGMVLISLGLYILPARRRRAKKAFDAKMEELRTRLHTAMTDQFQKELNQTLSRVQDAIAPYTRFIRSEQQKTELMKAQVAHIDAELAQVRDEVEKLGK
jgi:small GTP-binding protein